MGLAMPDDGEGKRRKGEKGTAKGKRGKGERGKREGLQEWRSPWAWVTVPPEKTDMMRKQKHALRRECPELW
jgi:hypothetical protein